MNRTEFIEEYYNIAKKALAWADKSLREGMLSLEDEFDDPEKIEARDIFVYGIRLAIDGVDREIVDRILSNIIAQEKDESLHALKNIQKEAVLGIQSGIKPRVLYPLLNSFTDIPLNKDKTMKVLEEGSPGYDSTIISFPK